jgi:hypothetical protein
VFNQGRPVEQTAELRQLRKAGSLAPRGTPRLNGHDANPFCVFRVGFCPDPWTNRHKVRQRAAGVGCIEGTRFPTHYNSADLPFVKYFLVIY